MAISLISVYPIDTGNENETLRQLATAVVATSFNDYMMGHLHPAYVEQVRNARNYLNGYLRGDEKAEEYYETALRLMDGCFFRRVQWIRKAVMLHKDERTIREAISKMDAIVQEEGRRTDYKRNYDSAMRFFHSPLYDLYTDGMIDLATALRHCDEEIEKEKARIR